MCSALTWQLVLLEVHLTSAETSKMTHLHSGLKMSITQWGSTAMLFSSQLAMTSLTDLSSNLSCCWVLLSACLNRIQDGCGHVTVCPAYESNASPPGTDWRLWFAVSLGISMRTSIVVGLIMCSIQADLGTSHLSLPLEWVKLPSKNMIDIQADLHEADISRKCFSFSMDKPNGKTA